MNINLKYLLLLIFWQGSFFFINSQNTVQDGDFSDPQTWGGTVPSSNGNIVINHDVVLDQLYQANSINVTSSGSLTDSGSFVLTINDNGSITNDGILNFSSTTIQFNADAIVDGNNPRIFHNVNLFNFGLSTGVNFGSQTTINGEITINETAFVDGGSPIYGPNSTLRYNNGSFYNRSSEWSNTNPTQGNPHHVIINPGTELNLGSENPGNPAVLTGNLTIEPGGSIYMDVGSGPGSDDMEDPLVVGGNLDNEGTIILSDLSGGDLVVEGNFTNADGSTIEFNNRALFFEGDAVQQYNTPNQQLEIPFLILNKNNGEVVLNDNVSVIGNGTGLQMLDNSILNLNGYNLVIGENANPPTFPTPTSTQVDFSVSAFIKGSETSKITLKGNANMGDIAFDQTTDGTTNALSSIYLQKSNSNSVGFSNKVILNDSIDLNQGTLNSKGNLVFKSDASKTAIVSQVANGSISDYVVIQRYFPLSNRAFRYISPSVNTASSSKPTIHENWQEGASDATSADPYTDANFNPHPGFGTHITGSQGMVGTVDTSNGLDRTQTGNNSLWEWKEATQEWDSIISTNQASDILEAGKGYALMVRGDRSATLESNTDIGSNPATLRTTGTIETGNFSPTIDAGVVENDFVLIGNPYQARVDMENIVTNAMDINPTYMWIWDPNIGTIGGYAVVTLSDGSVDEVDIDGNSLPQSSGANEFLETFQACFLEVDGNNPSITFVETAKSNTIANNGTFSDDESIVNSLELELYRDGHPKVFDAVRLRFSDNYNTTPSFEDAKKFWNTTERLSLINQNTYLAIDKRKLPQSNDTIPLYLGNYQTSQYTLKLASTLDDNTQAQLYDHYLQQAIDIDNGNNTYNFTIDQNIPETYDSGRFELIFNPQTLSTTPSPEPGRFSVYPNPTRDVIYIAISSEHVGTQAQMSCFDVMGRQVLSQKDLILKPNTPVDLSSLPSGIYLLKLDTPKHQQNFKIQIE